MAIVAILAAVGVSYASQWYYSSDRATSVVAYQITLDPIDAQTTQYQNITFTGIVTLGGNPIESITVYLYKNSAEVDTTTTNQAGQYTFTYNVTDAVGTNLIFKTGVNT